MEPSQFSFDQPPEAETSNGQTTLESESLNQISGAEFPDESNENKDDYYESDDDDYSSNYSYDMAFDESNSSSVINRNQTSDEESQYIYRCFSFDRSITDKSHLENSNQIIMPPSALDYLISDTSFECLMLFEIRNFQSSGRLSHCGVSEFTAEEGSVLLPKWMMNNLQLQEGDFVNTRRVNLADGTFMKLQPHSMDFLAIPNPKTALEQSLSNNFFCVTTGDTIMINYEGKSFYINIVETKPSSAICILNTDCEVDFAPPLDYKEPEKPASSLKYKKPENSAQTPTVKPKFLPFTGVGRRLNGESSTQVGLSSTQKENPTADISKRNLKENAETETLKTKQFQPFTGRKYSLRD